MKIYDNREAKTTSKTIVNVSYVILYSVLQQSGACEEARAWVSAKKRSLYDCIRDMLDPTFQLDWIVWLLDSAPATWNLPSRDEYDARRKVIWEEYEARFRVIRDEYDARLKVIRDGHEARLKVIRDEYKAQRQPIWDEYKAKRQPIWDEYKAKRQPIWDEYAAKRQPIWDEYLIAIQTWLINLAEGQ